MLSVRKPRKFTGSRRRPSRADCSPPTMSPENARKNAYRKRSKPAPGSSSAARAYRRFASAQLKSRYVATAASSSCACRARIRRQRLVRERLNLLPRGLRRNVVEHREEEERCAKRRIRRRELWIAPHDLFEQLRRFGDAQQALSEQVFRTEVQLVRLGIGDRGDTPRLLVRREARPQLLDDAT